MSNLPPEETNDLIEQRRKNLEHLRSQGVNVYGGRVDGLVSIASVLDGFEAGRHAKVAGRVTAWRSHGKTIFADVLDATKKIQIYVKKTEVDPDSAKVLDYIDIGDIISAEGETFVTKTQMPTLHVKSVRLLSKSLRPLPEKWHGLKDTEIRYRQRYLDLISNDEARSIFVARSKAVSAIRSYLNGNGYLEVETPMMHPIPGGAAGKPFKTHHASLDMELFLRIAPELYLKRLLVGGFERVYELNKSFRNEGISTRHNPEFTMLETYTAYTDVNGVMDLCENLVREAARAVLGTDKFEWQGMEIDVSKFERVSFLQLMGDAYGITEKDAIEVWAEKLKKKGVHVGEGDVSRTKLLKIIGDLLEPAKRKHPVFVTDHFTELCPLAKTRPDNPAVSERFELYMGGMELANGYSELNDPREQLERFQSDVDADEAKDFEGLIDHDFVRALEFGMPPAGGLGIGIDRLVMLITNQASIREVILFPQLKRQG